MELQSSAGNIPGHSKQCLYATVCMQPVSDAGPTISDITHLSPYLELVAKSARMTPRWAASSGQSSSGTATHLRVTCCIRFWLQVEQQ